MATTPATTDVGGEAELDEDMLALGENIDAKEESSRGFLKADMLESS